MASPNTYVVNEGSSNVTGVTLTLTSLEGDIYNRVTVSRQPFAPVLPRFMGRAPRVVPVRVILTQNLVDTIAAQISFDENSFGFTDPTNTTVYYRPTPGAGIFVPLTSEYNWVTHQVQASMDGFGEFIFGFPDLNLTYSVSDFLRGSSSISGIASVWAKSAS